MSHFSILEKAPFSGLKLTSVYILGDDLSPLNVALFLKSKLFWRKSEWNFSRNCSDTRGTDGLARDLLAYGTLYHMEPFTTWNPLPKLSFALFLRWFLPFAAIYARHIDICIQFYSYSGIDARNHCQDVDNCGDEDHCQFHLGIDHCQTGNCCQDREHCQNGN